MWKHVEAQHHLQLYCILCYFDDVYYPSHYRASLVFLTTICESYCRDYKTDTCQSILKRTSCMTSAYKLQDDSWNGILILSVRLLNNSIMML